MSRLAPRLLRKSHKMEEKWKAGFVFLYNKVVLYQSIWEKELKNTHCAYYTEFILGGVFVIPQMNKKKG